MSCPVVDAEGPICRDHFTRDRPESPVSSTWSSNESRIWPTAISIAQQPDTPFHDIEMRMIELNQRFVPVLSGGKTVGVITRTDLLRSLHEDVIAGARGKPNR